MPEHKANAPDISVLVVEEPGHLASPSNQSFSPRDNAMPESRYDTPETSDNASMVARNSAREPDDLAAMILRNRGRHGGDVPASSNDAVMSRKPRDPSPDTQEVRRLAKQWDEEDLLQKRKYSKGPTSNVLDDNVTGIQKSRDPPEVHRLSEKRHAAKKLGIAAPGTATTRLTNADTHDRERLPFPYAKFHPETSSPPRPGPADIPEEYHEGDTMLALEENQRVQPGAFHDTSPPIGVNPNAPLQRPRQTIDNSQEEEKEGERSSDSSVRNVDQPPQHPELIEARLVTSTMDLPADTNSPDGPTSSHHMVVDPASLPKAEVVEESQQQPPGLLSRIILKTSTSQCFCIVLLCCITIVLTAGIVCGSGKCSASSSSSKEDITMSPSLSAVTPSPTGASLNEPLLPLIPLTPTIPTMPTPPTTKRPTPSPSPGPTLRPTQKPTQRPTPRPTQKSTQRPTTPPTLRPAIGNNTAPVQGQAASCSLCETGSVGAPNLEFEMDTGSKITCGELEEVWTGLRSEECQENQISGTTLIFQVTCECPGFNNCVLCPSGANVGGPDNELPLTLSSGEATTCGLFQFSVLTFSEEGCQGFISSGDQASFASICECPGT